MDAIKFDEHIGINLYRALSEENLSEKDKAKVISEVIEEIVQKFPNLKNIVTKRELSETELRLTKEIKDIELKINEVELKLTKEINEVELKLTKEIKEVELRLTKEIKDSKFEIIKWFIGSLIAQAGLIVAILKLLG